MHDEVRLKVADAFLWLCVNSPISDFAKMAAEEDWVKRGINLELLFLRCYDDFLDSVGDELPDPIRDAFTSRNTIYDQHVLDAWWDLLYRVALHKEPPERPGRKMAA